MTDSLRLVSLALRSLLRAPGWTAVAVLTLALGIGANTMLFSAVHAVLVKPLAYGVEGERLVAVFEQDRRHDELNNPTSPANFLDWSQASSLTDWTAARVWSPVLVGGDEPMRVRGLLASPALFRLLGSRPALGSTFREAGGGAAEERVVVLGDELWHRLFGGDPGVIGRAVTLDHQVYTVIGVMPPGFRFPPFWAGEAELWAPLALDPAARDARFLRVFARLADGATLEQAQAEMATIGARLEQEFPAQNTGTGPRVEPLLEATAGSARRPLLLLFGATGLLLLLACVNVANLALVRANGRRAEIALRAALGASRARLAIELLVESCVLALASGAAGLLLAVWGIEALARLLPADFPRRAELTLDSSALAFTLGTALLAGLLFGVLPALQAVRRDLAGSAGSARGRSTGSRSRAPLNLLVIAEISLALMLLVGAGLLGRSLFRLLAVDPGYEAGRALAFEVSFAASGHTARADQGPFFAQLLSEVAAVPGVESCGLINNLPIGGDLWRTPFAVDGQEASSTQPLASIRTASPGYFAAMGVAHLAGRDLSALDQQDAAPVVVVNQTLAERYFPGGDAVGRRLRTSGAWQTVVGVVGDMRQGNLADEVRPEIYYPYGQNPTSFYQQTTLVVRPAADPRAVAAAVRERVRALDGSLAVSQGETLAVKVEASVGSARLQALLVNLFAALALLLAGVGIYGVMSYNVAQRNAEIGIRMAVGARRRDILDLVLRESLGLTGAGIVLGLLGAGALAGFLRSLLFGVGEHDLASFVGAAVVVAVVGTLATYLPARRAAGLDPLRNLRRD